MSMQIVSRYSIIVILEVVDKTGKAMDKFMKKLNSTGSDQQCPYILHINVKKGHQAFVHYCSNTVFC